MCAVNRIMYVRLLTHLGVLAIQLRRLQPSTIESVHFKRSHFCKLTVKYKLG